MQDPADTNQPSAQTQSRLEINGQYLQTPTGILKFVEAALDIIVLICVGSVGGWSWYASGGWINFVAASSLISSILFLCLHLFGVVRSLPGNWPLYELVVQLVWSVCYLVSMIVAFTSGSSLSAVIAAGVFCLFAAISYGADVFVLYRTSFPGGIQFTTSKPRGSGEQGEGGPDGVSTVS